MTDRTRKTIIFAALPAAVIWAVFNLPSGNSTEPAAIPPSPQPSAAVPVAAPVTPGAGLIDIDEYASKPWGEDPFRTAPAETSSLSEEPLPREWILKGIVYTEDDPLAFINRRSVRVGDVINDGEVTAINKKSVTIRYDDNEITLTVNKG